MIRVRIAERSDQPRLVEFIRDHWSATHVFVDRPDVFAWQYGQADGRLNMVFAEEVDGPSSAVLGVLGFIPLGRFAPDLGDTDVMLAIWKVREDGAPPGLGLRLLKYLQAQLRPRLIAAIGTSEMVRPIYEVLRYRTGSLHHSAIFHPGRRDRLRIAAGVPDEAFEPAERNDSIVLAPIDENVPDDVRTAIDSLARVPVPTKSWGYVLERYLRHPWYRYEVRTVADGGALVAVVVWRAVEANGARLLRIVDVIGETEWLRHARSVLQHEVVAADAEYIDLMQWGIDEEVLRAAGFVGPTTEPGLVLPNYFAPFERRNIEIELACKVLDGDDGHVRLFRADSDQDRPNLVTEIDS